MGQQTAVYLNNQSNTNNNNHDNFSHLSFDNIMKLNNQGDFATSQQVLPKASAGIANVGSS